MMISRRHLLAGTGGAAALALTGGLGAPAFGAQVRKVGIQLYTVRNIFMKDPAGTLEKIARIGFREVEFGGGNYEAMDHAMLRRTMDRHSLTAPSLHIAYEALMGQFDESIAMAKALGADTVVIPHMGPSFYKEERWEEAVANFNRIAVDLRKAGLGLAYHNHDFEFAIKPDGVSLYDRLLTGTDPALVKIELDLYWAVRAKQDAGALIDRLADRLYSYHVKDMAADGKMAAVGQGKIDFAALFARKGSAAVRHFYVENDEAPAPYFPDITTSFNAVRALRF